ncbi:MAG: valine--tRNA ligase [Bacteroidota bacterium]
MSNETSTSANKTSTTAYDPTQIEARWYRYWEDGGFFRADASSGKPTHVIAMPPPNVTGRLHMGHGLQDTVQDAYTRLRRMQGYEALWIPGLDHAGIATQNVVERTLKKTEGKTRHDLGREAFVERVYDWKEEYGEIILQQKRRLGVSADWSRQRFTMDEGFSRAVQHVFVKLHEQGLIYKGDYLVNWDPGSGTVISNEEVDNVERDGHLWWIQYPFVEGEGHITIATTRPETMLGDTAVAVNPDDDRYRTLIGKKVLLPLAGREIPIIADAYVKADFGAGALKVTPAHDENDFALGQRHGLDSVTVIDFDAKINENGGHYAGMDRFAARKTIVADLEKAGLLEKVEPYRHTVPISSRSKQVIEPLLSPQWYVRMQPLADRALGVVRDGTITFHPDRWKNEYFRWLEDIRDWPISRQLWWGHRIPVWYYTDDRGEIDEHRPFVVSVDQPEPGMVQDEDVLDTWFSSWLWPFATLGWPHETDDLKTFYPGTVLVSGYDILFFWIARMIMAGLHFTDEVPYTDVFITGMIKDKQGRWMSKSLGNGIDPLDMIEQYGADAVRFTLSVLCAQGQDIKLDPAKFEGGRNFANKIWNAFRVFGRFMVTDVAGRPVSDHVRTRSFDELDLVERWMLTRLQEGIRDITASMDRYRISEAANRIYDLFWRDYCDWYLELIKPTNGADGELRTMDPDKLALAVEIYEQLTKLLHPFMPFITEDLWWRLRPREEDEACIAAGWPEADGALEDADAATAFSLIQDLVTAVRSVRAQYNVPPSKGIAVTVNVDADRADLVAVLDVNRATFASLAGVDTLSFGTSLAKPKASAAVVVDRHEVFVPLAGMIDLDQERARLTKEIEQKQGFLRGVERKLANENFVSRAPEAVVEKERQKAADARAEIAKLEANRDDLG